MLPTEIDELDVYRDARLVGRLRRTKTGSEFRYDDAFVDDVIATPHRAAETSAIAFALPPTKRPGVARPNGRRRLGAS